MVGDTLPPGASSCSTNCTQCRPVVGGPRPPDRGVFRSFLGGGKGPAFAEVKPSQMRARQRRQPWPPGSMVHRVLVSMPRILARSSGTRSARQGAVLRQWKSVMTSRVDRALD